MSPSSPSPLPTKEKRVGDEKEEEGKEEEELDELTKLQVRFMRIMACRGF